MDRTRLTICVNIRSFTYGTEEVRIIVLQKHVSVCHYDPSEINYVLVKNLLTALRVWEING